MRSNNNGLRALAASLTILPAVFLSMAQIPADAQYVGLSRTALSERTDPTISVKGDELKISPPVAMSSVKSLKTFVPLKTKHDFDPTTMPGVSTKGMVWGCGTIGPQAGDATVITGVNTAAFGKPASGAFKKNLSEATIQLPPAPKTAFTAPVKPYTRGERKGEAEVQPVAGPTLEGTPMLMGATNGTIGPQGPDLNLARKHSPPKAAPGPLKLAGTAGQVIGGVIAGALLLNAYKLRSINASSIKIVAAAAVVALSSLALPTIVEAMTKSL